jgi:O-6-methylguanine DNA methyltransferase
VGWRLASEGRPPFVERTLAMLVALEAGREDDKELALATDLVGEPFASILKVAAAIPRGFVTTYGDVAKATGAEAREVGTAMARNPVYPIVPCHRVVGAGFALVGYAGSRAPAALRAKLDRLAKEARGLREECDVPTALGPLHVYPVERALARAAKDEADAKRQRSLFE